MNKMVQFLCVAAAAAGLSPALAELVPAGPTDGAAAAEAPPFAGATGLGKSELARITGRDDIAMSVQARNTSNVSNNAVIGHSQTGTINFDAAAFQNLNGLSLLSANTGNNVSINSSLNMNISIRP